MTGDPPSRRRVLTLCGGLLTAGLAGCGTRTGDGGGGDGEATDSTVSGGPTGETTSPVGTTPGEGATGGTATATDGATGTPGDDSTVRARRVASGFAAPVGVEIPQPGRRFIVDQVGRVYLQDETGVRDESFLDVTDRMVALDGYTEQGLLGLAFHPEFADNGRFFVRYSAPPREGTPGGYSHTFVLSEFRADPGARTADPDAERTLLEIPQPQGNHNAGAVAFGPDGYLYVATGDGGGANDRGNGHVEDWYDGVDGGNGQDVTENLLGSVLRIDVDSEDGDRNYAVPDDNPLVGEEGLDEQYAWGFRNPWRMSFGPAGRLFVADVGQGAWEEVDVVESGGNYGWNVREGTHCFGADECPAESPRGRPLRDPVVEYPHSGDPVSGIAVIGGYLYDGSEMSAFDGQYLFADWRAGGSLFAARERSDGLWPTRVVSVESNVEFGPNVLAFGRNPAGELFVATTASTTPSGTDGVVFRLEASD